MKNIIFYIQGEWAFGSIHTEMSKFLLQHGINARLLDWTKAYSKESIQELSEVIDYFVTVPDGALGLINFFGIDISKIIICLHARSEIDDIINKFQPNYLDNCANFIAVSQYLVDEATINLNRVPVLCEMGINFTSFDTKISDNLSTIGYAGTFHARNQQIDPNNEYYNKIVAIKRSYLAQDVASITNSFFKVAQWYTNTFISMPGFYKSVDCIIITSTTEGAGLPILEGLASGKLVMTTNVGIAKQMNGINPIILNMNEEDLINEATEIINFYKKYPKLYQNVCLSGKELAKKYDWSIKILPWAKELNV